MTRGLHVNNLSIQGAKAIWMLPLLIEMLWLQLYNQSQMLVSKDKGTIQTHNIIYYVRVKVKIGLGFNSKSVQQINTFQVELTLWTFFLVVMVTLSSFLSALNKLPYRSR